MSETDAIEFRKQADDARQMASRAVSPRDKAEWLLIAEEWLKLAQEADKPTRLRYLE
jgi:hypothetical protein